MVLKAIYKEITFMCDINSTFVEYNNMDHSISGHFNTNTVRTVEGLRAIAPLAYEQFVEKKLK